MTRWKLTTLTTGQIIQGSSNRGHYVDAYEADKILLDTYGDTVTIKRPRDGADDDQEPSAGTDGGQKKKKKEERKTMQIAEVPFEAPAHQEFKTESMMNKHKEEVQHLPDWFQQPTRLPSPDHAWNKSVPAVHESVQPWLSNLAQQDPRESFDELTDSTFDFSAFVLNRLNVQTLTPELLAGPTFELMKGTCKSLTELEYFCEEKLKALEDNFSELKQTNQYAEALSSIPGIIDQYLANKMKEAIDVAVQLKYDKIREESNTENQQFLDSIDEGMKKVIKEQVKKEVYKANTEKLDWINPEVRQYPHDLRQPLPLVPNSKGRHVIPFHHFINNDLEYLRSGESSRKYSTSVTKTTAADYRHIKWIEDLVPNSMWSQMIVKYDKFSLWGISHWGKKRRQFYAFATLRESARDVYSKRWIIAVTKVEIVEWQNYKHLDWITVRRDDDVLYKFKEGDFHRLRIQDIEDMLLLLVQGKVTNLNVEERIAFNVSLRMFTRSIVIQRRVEDLQLGVESYQKKLNLTKPDMYRSNLRRQDAYTPYSDPRGFIYENKDKKNRLMRIDELHKFSDGTLDDVRTALNDRLKGIRMEYLPQTFWSQRDKANARAMIQAIDKRLKTRRIMRSLERFVGGRPYGVTYGYYKGPYDLSYVVLILKRFNTSAGNPVKKILLKLNLSDHRLFKMVVECRSVKVKEFQERCNIKAFQEWYEHVGPEVASSQDGKVTRWRRDCAWLMISRCSRSQCQIQIQGTSSIQEVNDHYNIFTRESQEYELKTKDKA
ncbi:hypothetical protein Tco_0015899 [Tanacetum coccineum]